MKKRIQDTFVKFGTKAKNKMDLTALEYKIKVCTKEINENLKKIGTLVYKAHNTQNDINEEEIISLCAEINALELQIKKLRGKITDINRESKNKDEPKEQIDNTEQKKYTKINIKQEDLRVIRTEEGIKILRFCPACDTGNDSGKEKCTKCGYLFKK